MTEALRDAAVAEDQWARLRRVVDDGGPSVDAEILLGHWGCPRLDSDMLDLIRTGDLAHARERLQTCLSSSSD